MSTVDNDHELTEETTEDSYETPDSTDEYESDADYDEEDYAEEDEEYEDDEEYEETSRSGRGMKILDILVPTVCIAVILFSGFKLFQIYKSYAEAEAIYDGVALYVKEGAATENATVQEEMVHAGFPYLDIDYDSLLQINEDFLGWLYFPLLDLSYPVVYGDEESSYLHEAIDGTKSSSGCIYIDAWSDPNLRDMTTIIYGHNMRNGSMFGSLKKIRTEEGLVEQDPYFYYYTPTKAYKCHIFAYYLENANGKTYNYPTDNKTYDEYMDYILEKNEYEGGPETVDLSHRPRVLTLSTCSGRNSGRRTVIHSVIEDTYEYSDDLVIDETFEVSGQDSTVLESK